MAKHPNADEPHLRSDPDAAEHQARFARAVAGAGEDQLATYLRPALARLSTVENGLAHFKASIPAMERECAAIRQNVSAVTDRLARVA